MNAMTDATSTPPSPPGRQSGARRLPQVITWLACWALLVALVVPRNPSAVAGDWGPFSFNDFRDTVYLPIRDLLHGNLPWDTDAYLARHPGVQIFPAYLPFYFLALFPLALLPYQAAIALWLGVTTASFVWLVDRGLRWAFEPLMARHGWLVAPASLFFLAARPVKSALFQGQLALPCAAAALVALTHGGRALHSAIAWIKPPVGIPLTLVQVVTHRTHKALRGLGLALLASIPVGLVAVAVADGVAPAVHALLGTARAGSGEGFMTYVDLYSLPSHLMSSPPAWLNIVALLLSLALTLPSAMVAHHRWPGTGTYYLTAVALAMVLITPSMLYTLVVFIPALLSLLALALDGDQGPWTRAGAVVMGLCMGAPVMFPEGIWARTGLSQTGQLAAITTLLVVASLVLAMSIIGNGTGFHRSGRHHARTSVPTDSQEK